MPPTTSAVSRFIASDEAVAAAQEFDRFLGQIAPEYLDRFDPRVWQQVVDGGWLEIGTADDESAFTLIDLAEFAEVWGARLVPGPFTTSVLALSAAGAAESAAGIGHTYALAGAAGLVPFGHVPGVVHLGGGPVADAAPDDFAPSLPVSPAGPDAGVSDAFVAQTLVLYGAESIGAARACLEQTIPFTTMREAYGQPLSSFQAVRHRLADMHKTIEAARSLLLLAVLDPADALGAVEIIARDARTVIEGTIQVHGGMGFTWDMPMHRYLRHVMTIERILRSLRG
ncbi:acyl-CoA dehydrogenase family protein [Microbacterium sp. X-17]|uniref:acyl-CoA dehydrogenase family protein n=1 Tax=Microbacterium sp. X-17 TaxID=3144404 RepID=UPI0031F4E965